jgi:hypothetical protein
MVDKEKFTEISSIIFNEFYFVLLSDSHTSRYFTSFEILNDLIKKQADTIRNVFELFEKSDDKKKF